jgi:Gas vesicle synthesis protein GvpO
MAESSKSNGRLSARELTVLARESVEELTGYPPESVSGLEHEGDTWRVAVDVCELERIPSTTDVLATYVVELDDSGELVGYRRIRRFQRGAAEEG